jgi:hypothetical protein
MEAKQFTLKAKTPKNQAILNRTIKALVKYNNLNNQRDKADDSGDEKLYRKLNRQCEVAFDKYLELADELPKYEKDRLENSDVYLHYAKGGMMQHGLKVGDKITADKGNGQIQIYNKSKREDGSVNLEMGKRNTSKYAKGGKTKQDPPIVRSYFEDEAIDYGQGGKIASRNEDFDEKSEITGKKRYAVEIQDAKSRDTLDFEYFDSEKEAKDFISKYRQGGTMTGWCYSIGGL